MNKSKHAEQVEVITTALRDVPMEPGELPQFLMLYIEDMSFGRGAICEAEKKIKQERGWKD